MSEVPPDKLLIRDRATLDRLSLLHRWELTRRHPYYLQHWEAAGAYCADPGRSPEGVRSVQLLKAALGWAGQYPAPAIDNPWLEDPHHAAFATLTCAFPVTPRTLLRHLINLPADLRETCARILRDELSGGPDELGNDETVKHWRRIKAVENWEHPLLDEPTRGLIVISPPDAPMQGVREDIGKIVPTWGGAGEDKRRSAKLEDHLAIWDLREGWNGGGYDTAKEKRLRDIKAALGAELGTVQYRYQAAFQLITGHEYTPERWAVLFGPLKASRWKSWRRSKPRSEGVKLVPETQLGKPDVAANARDQGAASDVGMHELVEDIRGLLGKGRTDDQIVDDLGMDLTIARDDALKLVAYFRARRDDGL